MEDKNIPPPPDDFWCVVDGETYKFFRKPGSARGFVSSPISGHVPRGGTIYHYTDGKWVLDRHVVPNNICVKCEKPIDNLYKARLVELRAKVQDRRWQHSRENVASGIKCEAPAQLKLHLE